MSPKGQRKQGAAKKGAATPANKAVAKKTRAAKAAVSKQADPAEGAEQKSPSPSQDAIALLRADHCMVEKMFAQYPSASDEDKAQPTHQVCQSLSIHARLEDELFYPACREQGIDTDLMDEAQVEHDSAAVLIEELGRSSFFRSLLRPAVAPAAVRAATTMTVAAAVAVRVETSAGRAAGWRFRRPFARRAAWLGNPPR